MALVGCSWNSAQLSSGSLTGDYSYLSDETWHILGEAFRYVWLQFDRFHVECSIQSAFEIRLSDDITRTLCNTNRAIRGIKSLSRELTITFKFNKDADRILEGFSATYEMMSNYLSVDSLVTSEWSGAYFWLLFRLCYIIFPLTNKSDITTVCKTFEQFMF